MKDVIFTKDFKEIELKDIALVGGKNASLGEMIKHLSSLQINVPQGFALTTEAYWQFMNDNNLTKKVMSLLSDFEYGTIDLPATGKKIRSLILSGIMPAKIVASLEKTYQQLCSDTNIENVSVAVRSSATAEDLPEASFAGQHDSFLNISGVDALIVACQKCIASLFTDRAITYRSIHGIENDKVALSVGIQMMVRSDKACAGVMFSIETETGFADAAIINAAWGLGEAVVSGETDPDEYLVFKPFLDDPSLVPIIQRKLGAKKMKVIYDTSSKIGTESVATPQKEQDEFVLEDDEILELARSAKNIEQHYGVPMDMEWAKDWYNNQLYIIQARPETVQTKRNEQKICSYTLIEKGTILMQGLSIGEAIASGEVCLLSDLSEISRFVDGAVLVTPKTDPDWLPVMRRASALVTDHGGRTSHAAIVSRELGIPAVIGTGNASEILQNGQSVTVSCAEGSEGFVYDGSLAFEKIYLSNDDIPETKTKVMLNIANPYSALHWWPLPADGIGLARMEFIISNNIKIHPMALVDFDKVTDAEARTIIEDMTALYSRKEDYFIEKLALDISLIAASRHPKPVIVRLSDFKSNEYANLIGGAAFEPQEDNPMIGWRGASRYYDKDYSAAFALECQALAKVRNEIGFKNVIIMVPFCRTIGEADAVLEEMKKHNLIRGENGLEVYVMAEIPANIILAEDFADRFDGFSIGSNDLTQLTLGIDRDSARLANLFDAGDPAVISLIRDLIKRAHKKGVKVSFCGQAPSDDAHYAQILVDAGIDSISVTPDSFISVKNKVASVEQN